MYVRNTLPDTAAPTDWSLIYPSSGTQSYEFAVKCHPCAARVAVHVTNPTRSAANACGRLKSACIF